MPQDTVEAFLAAHEAMDSLNLPLPAAQTYPVDVDETFRTCGELAYWACRLSEYAGRLHREHSTKTDVHVIDFIDTGHPTLLRMWEKRLRGYRAMGYRVESKLGSADLLASTTVL